MNVLHVPYTYFPDPCGGTEVYVQALAQALAPLGFASAIAAPGRETRTYTHDGLTVHRFAVDPSPTLDHAYGFPDARAAAAFDGVLQALRPHVVHLHARTAAISEHLIDAAHAAGAQVVFTYHTPTVTCARGTMLEFGRSPCDGKIAATRCTACALAALEVPFPLARALALASGLSATAARLRSGMPHLRIPSLIAESRPLVVRFLSKADRIVAVCDWVRDALIANGVPSAKILLSRQGIASKQRSAPPKARPDGPLRVAFFGRIAQAKGATLLTEALALMPDAALNLDIYGSADGQGSQEQQLLHSYASRDRRVRLLDPAPPPVVTDTMARYDLIAVPSQILETGPLVVLEAFAAGVPVLGAAHGGIAELVRDDIDGRLVAAGNPRAWGSALATLAHDPAPIARWRTGIKPPRTIEACARDMAALYRTQ